MSSRSIFSKTADVLQRGAVLGLLSAFGFQCYQIVTKTWEGQVDSPHMHSTYLKGKSIALLTRKKGLTFLRGVDRSSWVDLEGRKNA
eukprot:scaffold310_cov168-Amphora_coffeaeformis.AAC.8